MPIIVSNKQGSSDPAPAGTHHAICYGVVAVGTIPDEKYPSRPKAVLLFELPSERINVNGSDLPRGLSKRFTLSLHQKSSMRKALASWRGRDFTEEELAGFEVDKLVGANALINVIHEVGSTGSTYANVSAIMALPKGSAKKTSENPPLCWNISDAIATAVKAGRGEIEFPAKMPEWIQKLARTSDEYTYFKTGKTQAAPAGPTANQLANLSEGAQEEVPF